MSKKIGMPTLKLKLGNGFGKHSGNAKAVVLEALKERYSSDSDLDRSLTQNNLYFRDETGSETFFESGEELFKYWESEARKYRVTDKNGKEKKLRSDASIGFAHIIKPDKELMDSLSEEEQLDLLSDTADLVVELYRKKGCVIDAGVVHLDEGNPHIHLFGHDPEYQLGKKINLKFFGALNRDVPKKLRQKGWDVEECSSYDVEAVKNMTDAEREAYTAEMVKKKKKTKRGKSSRAYKDEKEKERIAKAEAELQKREAELQAEYQERLNNLRKRYQQDVKKAAGKMSQKAVNNVLRASENAQEAEKENTRKISMRRSGFTPWDD